MRLVAIVEQLIAEEADGLLKSVKAVAAHVETLGGTLPAPEKLMAAIEADFNAKVDAFLVQAKAGVEAKIAELESEVTAALAKLHPAAATLTPQPSGTDAAQEQQAAPQQAS